jgi:predicted permease
MQTLWQDLRYGARMLLKQKSVTAIAVLSLALGIGANTALFSVVDAMLLKRLPVKEPQRLALFQIYYTPGKFSPGSYDGLTIDDPATGQTRMTSFPPVSYQRMREQQGALSHLFAFFALSLNVLADGQADVANGQVASGNYYAGLGVQPLLGRLLTDDDDKPNATPVAVLSYRYWQKRFSGDAGIVGKQINLNNVAFTVIGVTPQGFNGTGQVGDTRDITIPLALEPQLNSDPKSSRYGAGQWFLILMGRLKTGATLAQAQSQLENAFQQSVAEHRAARNAYSLATGGKALGPLDPKDYPRLALASGAQGEMNSREFYAPSLYLLLGVVGMVLLIACANTANLLLSRASSRQKEIGVRLALGASRGRLMRQLLTESVLLAAVGGALGLLFAMWIKDGLLAVGDWGGPDMRWFEAKLDVRVLGFTMGLSLLTGLVFGLVPAWRATKVDLTPTLKDSERGSGAASRSLFGRGLVVMQVALSLLLLIGAGLFVRTLVNLQRTDPGFNTKNLLLFNVSPALNGYQGERLAQFYDRMTERLNALPGALKVTFSDLALLRGQRRRSSVYLRDAFDAPADANGDFKQSGVTYILHTGENFWETMEIPLLAGRAFTKQDNARAPKVAVVNQSFAKEFFPNESPIGKRFTFDSKKPDEVEIVGLVKDAKYRRQRDDAPSTTYLPWRQDAYKLMGQATVEMRFTGNPNATVAAVRQAMLEVDENLPLTDIKTQVEQADETLRMERLFAKLVTLFGLLAQQLASIGLFGVLAYAVSQRTREIGIRMALGATQTDVLKMVIKQGMTLAVIGVALGLGGAYALTKYLESLMQLSNMLYGVKPTDPMTYGVTSVLLTLVALIACYLPARRATKVDPMVALRCE